MIHRDLCDPINTKNYSPLRMQFHFLLSRYVCWDGLIPLTTKEIAEKISCNVQSIRKFIKKGCKEEILEFVGDRLYLTKRVVDYRDGYVKHFPFLESEEFKTLSVHAQRFILYTLWAGIHTGRPLKRDIMSFYHSKDMQNGVLNIYYKDPLLHVLEEAKTFLKLEIINERNRDMIVVSGLQDAYASQEAMDNEGEMKLLEDTLWENGSDILVSQVSKEDILKLKKHYTSVLGAVGMELFSNALRKLLNLNKLYDLNMRGEVGVYLRSILTDLEQKLLPTLEKQIQNISNSLETIKESLIDGMSNWVNRFEIKRSILSNAIKWIKSKKPNPPDEIKMDFPFYNWLETT